MELQSVQVTAWGNGQELGLGAEQLSIPASFPEHPAGAVAAGAGLGELSTCNDTNCLSLTNCF